METVLAAFSLEKIRCCRLSRFPSAVWQHHGLILESILQYDEELWFFRDGRWKNSCSRGPPGAKKEPKLKANGMN
jgi:hypothetical protein